MTLRALAPLAMFCATTACLSTSPTPPATLCVDPRPSAPCRTATDVEGWLQRPDLEIVATSSPEKGRQGTRILTLAVPNGADRIVFRAKWRSLSTSSKLNNPRAELAAYTVQQLMLEPHEYVVPPTHGHCFELEHYRAHVDTAEPPAFPKTRCVYGILSYWLEDALSLKRAAQAGWMRYDRPYDAALFERSASYRQSVADVNLFAHVISHGDTHPNQFVVTGGAVRPFVYMVDNSTAFTSFRNPTIKPRADWSEIIVPALRRAVIERLRALDSSHLDTLAVVDQYEVRDGILVPTRRTPATSQRSSGFRWIGDELQVGLTEVEIAMLRSRIDALVARAASGDTRIF